MTAKEQKDENKPEKTGTENQKDPSNDTIKYLKKKGETR